MKISVIIPCRNEKGDIAGFLASVLKQELDPGCEMEILVADGMSDDGTREVLRQCDVRLIDNPGRIVSTGLNSAIEASTGDVIIRMDAHTTYAPDYIRESVRALERSGADNAGGPWVARGRGWIGKAITAAFQSRFCAGGGRAHDPNYEGEVDTVYLGCWRREAFGKFGMFDPQLVRNQDDEFNFRLRRRGGRIWQSPHIKSLYAPRESITALFRQYMQYGFWKVAVIRKHRGIAAWRHLIPALFVLSMIAGAVLAIPFHAIAAALGAELAIYAILCIAASLQFAKSLEWRSLLILPFVMAVYHVAYGLGFLAGILRPPRAEGRAGSAPSVFSELTR
jgi:glycosyltransferase involved in cell wall biosynthesis